MGLFDVRDDAEFKNDIIARLSELENQFNKNQTLFQTQNVSERLSGVDAIAGVATTTSVNFYSPSDHTLTKLLTPGGEIDVLSTNIIVTHPTDSVMNMFFMAGAAHDGQFAFVKPKEGKTLIMGINGNFDQDVAITVPDNRYRLMMFSAEAPNFWLPVMGDITNPVRDSIKMFGIGIDIGDSLIPLDNLNVKTIRLRQGVGVANIPSINSSTGNILDLNFPLGSLMVLSENGSSKYTWTAGTFTAPNIIVSNFFALQNSSINPLANGQFTLNGSDVKVFTGGSVVNLSTLGSGFANTALSNLTSPTSITQDLLFFSNTFDIGSSGTPLDNLNVQQIRFRNGTLISNIPNIVSEDGSQLTINVFTGNILNWKVNAVSKMTLSSSQMNLLGAMQISGATGLSLSEVGFAPISNGEFRLNSGSVEVFTGGGLVNLGLLAKRDLSQLTSPTLINVDLRFLSSGFDIANDAAPVEDIFVERVRFRTASSLVSNNAMITRNASNSMRLNVANGQSYLFYFNGFAEWTMSLFTLTGRNIILTNTFTLNDSSVAPNVNGMFTQNNSHVEVFSGGKVRNMSAIPEIVHRFYLHAGAFGPVDSGTLQSRIVGAGSLGRRFAFVEYIDGLNTYATANFEMPITWDTLIGLEISIVWTNPNGGAGNVTWQVELSAVDDGENIGTQAFSTIPKIKTDAVSAANDKHRTTIAVVAIGSAPTINSTLFLKVRRNGLELDDTYANIVHLISASVKFQIGLT